ncbi:aminotransferase class I/II-fold pyridoxal phosphate-dependent enzyme [Leucobacter luti]|uniref:aminotransferase class I/II-fold pyridoxal phosphate-dependent enzyme n=1 Tax=Leucobacter luti TaxID=340320 RepID=UPI00105CB425|nr:aminotransferase class I/II-fold pyridoxal phosphate-dependent enzyme [Leucobacter luti]QYM76501.1 amino acid decarboxylase [Leucobacter luti]
MLLQDSRFVDPQDQTARHAGVRDSQATEGQSGRRVAPNFGPEHERAPYAEALQRFADSEPRSFMVPGHGNDPAHGGVHLAELFGDRVPELDVPLMLPGIDLGDDSPLVQAQRLAADAWGAKRTWFLTNGASQANRTAAIAVRGLGERIMIQRSMHSSLTDGVLLAGLLPAFVSPNIDEHHGIAHGLTPEKLDEALTREAEAGRPVSSVLVVSPSYFGSTADVAGLAEVAHAHDAAIIVDGAWGAHFGFHPDLPESPARLGADLVVSSTHKLAGSLTQSAMLHLGDTRFAEQLEPLVARAYSMTASTSMSGILMGSLDVARRALVQGGEQIQGAVDAAEQLRERLREDPRFTVISDRFPEYRDIVATDALRIPVDVTALGQSGHWVRSRMMEAHDTYLEMSTATSVVLVVGALRTVDVDRFMRDLGAVADEAATLPAADAIAFPPLPEAGELRMRPREAFFGESDVVAAGAAVGRISADTLAAYPPGIPNLLPGEAITAETVAFLQAVATSPTGYVRGALDAEVATLRVVRE